jgi:ribosomal protein S18 acetylase RimI-like enzyme
MKAFHTADPLLFQQKIQGALEQDEAANQPMLVQCQQMIAGTLHSDSAVMTWTEDAQGVTAAAMLVAPGPLWLFCEPMTKLPSLRLLINMLRDVYFPGVKGKNHAVESFTALWSQMFGGSAARVTEERVYKLTGYSQLPIVAGSIRPAALPDAEQLVEWMAEYENEVTTNPVIANKREYILNEISKGNVFVWMDGLMVSMIIRTMQTSHGTALGCLFTPPVLRGRGYATMLTQFLCQRVLQEGQQFCSATVQPGNETANHLLLKLGFTIVCDIEEIKLIL